MQSWEGGQLREWRWNSLTDVVRGLLRREQPLKDHWDPQKFGHTAPAGPSITSAISSKLFWSYAKFLFLISGMIDSQSEYCEGCVCHEQWSRHNAHKARKTFLRKKMQHFAPGAGNHPPADDRAVIDHAPSACPLKGRRAPELANGAFVAFTQDLMEVSKAHLEKCISGLSPEDRATLLKDWVIATDT